MSSSAASATGLVVVPGSLRTGAVSTKIAHAAHAAQALGRTVTLATGLGALPLYNEDLDTDPALPAVAALRAQVAAAGGVLMISPAHNGSVSAALNNAIDWLSRLCGACALSGKPTALLVTGYSLTGVEAHLERFWARPGCGCCPPQAGR